MEDKRPIKITELIKNKGKFSYSFEVTPDVSEEDIDNLKVDPLFFSVTWHARIHKCANLNIDAIKTALLLRNKRKHVLLHLSCDMMKASYLEKLLTLLQENNICNLLLVLGEEYDPKTSDFKTTSEMIKFIREKSNDYFCIGIVGFPGCSEEKLLQIKEKIDAGANFVLTQAFFDVDAFKRLQECVVKMSPDVPVIPGVFTFETPKQLQGFIKLCKIKVSDDLLEACLNKEKMNKPCTEIVIELIQELTSKCNSTHFHFFTINKFESVQKLIKEIN